MARCSGGGVHAALAGPRPNRATTIRAHAAFAVAKEATLAAMAIGNGRLTPGDRGEILAAARRALHAAPLPQVWTWRSAGRSGGSDGDRDHQRSAKSC